MAVPDLIFRQKHLFNSLTESLQSLLTNGQCTVTAIGRGIDSDASERHCIKRADRLLSHATIQQAVDFKAE